MTTPSKARGTRAPRRTAASAANATLCVDVGGSGVKGAVVGPDGTEISERVRLPTAYPMPPAALVDMIADIAGRSPAASRASIGFPGMVRSGRVLSAPHFVTKKGPGTAVVPELVKAWSSYDLSSAVHERLGLPCRLANDADTQGLAAIHGEGLELVITLGTGIGTALFLDGELQTHLELSHHPLTRRKTYNEYVGDAALRKIGAEKWTKRVDRTVTVLAALTFFDRLYVGGGNGEHLTSAFSHEHELVPNADGILGGARLWSLHRVP
ncbi:MAG TPA: ROK family protein [Mycobacteriales bacterium]